MRRTADPRPVMVGVDGRRGASGPVDLAAGEASRRGAPLLIVHVWPGQDRGPVRTREPAPSRAAGRRLLEAAARRASLSAPDVPITTELLQGSAATVLADCSARAQLLVAGHRDDPATRAIWGSTAAHLARHSACPLLVNRGARRVGPIVVATSARPSGTLGHAFAEAALLRTPLVALHMWTRPRAANGTAPVIVRGGYTDERRAAEAELAAALTEWSARFPDVPVERLVVSDLDLARTVENASRRGRLLVAGIGRHGRFADLLSATAGAWRFCPVVLVPAAWRAAAPEPLEMR